MADEAEETFENPKWYRVCLNTIVRKNVELDSERLRILPMGSRVRVSAKKGRRVQIDQPILGWCSMQSSNGDTILQLIEEKSDQQSIATPKVAEVGSQLKEQHRLLEQKMTAATDEERAALIKQKEDLEVQLRAAQSQVDNYKKQMQSLQNDFAPGKGGSSNTELLRNGDVVLITQPIGVAILRYHGEVKGQDGMFVGVELSPDAVLEDGTPIGDTDGTIGGVEYFKVAPNCGRFFPDEDVKKIVSSESLLIQLHKALEKIALLENMLESQND